MQERAALLSVSDRTGILELAKELKARGYVLLATSGTAKYLKEEGLETHSIEAYTGQKEILDGRVKTLHPKIHAGLLAKRSNAQHMAQLKEDGILPIDIAVINLYPFIQNLNGPAAKDPMKMVELIDIGGPTMIRAAAKNFTSVLPLIDPVDYRDAIALIQHDGKESAAHLALRKRLSIKVFTTLANYNLEIGRYFSSVSLEESALTAPSPEEVHFAPVNGIVLEKAQELRYGENPHQKAVFYRPFGATKSGWTQLNGKELSYNNLLDFDATLKLVRALGTEVPSAVIIKHLNPCGVARAATPLEALKSAKRCDPRSHFGGILGFNQKVDKDVAEEIRGDFAEVVLAPAFDEEALALLRGNKNLRVLQVNLQAEPQVEVRSVESGILMQWPDVRVSTVQEASLVSNRTLSPSEIADLELAWTITAHVKSNAIVLVKEGRILGTGAGQMSRIDSVELALSKAVTHDHDVHGAVAASDAFFPFPDSVETLAKAGVKAIIAPAGAKRDAETVAAANTHAISLLFASDRHFRH